MENSPEASVAQATAEPVVAVLEPLAEVLVDGLESDDDELDESAPLDEPDDELSALAGSLAVEEPLRLSVR